MTYDITVIGGGPAGYVAAIKAAQLGGKVALVERDVVGGTCLNRGCIPTKTYTKNAETIMSIRGALKRGIVIADPNTSVDMPKLVKIKDQGVRRLTQGVSAILKSHEIDVYRGVGEITRDRAVAVGDRILESDKIIFAGGSVPAKINLPGIDNPRVLTSDEILDLEVVPRRLAIIGGGVIGVELGSAFRTFGSDVTIVEMTDEILPGFDPEVVRELSRSLKSMGIEVKTSTVLQGIEEVGDSLVLHLEGEKTTEVDYVLLSVGRVPDMRGIGEMEFEMEHGRIKVDDHMQTSVEGIYAPGDINGMHMLAHAAFKMGEVAAMNALGHSVKADLRNVPSCVYTLPEVASVGLTEEDALKTQEVRVGRFPFGGNGRALASGERRGFVKAVIGARYGELLGVHIVGPGATEMINEAAALMQMEITAHEISEIIHAHPTYSEAFMEAVADGLGKCIHLPKKVRG